MGRRERGSRRVVVDGRAYRWRVPHLPRGEDQALGWCPLTFNVWLDDAPGTLLEVHAPGPRPDNCFRTPGAVVTPRWVAEAVRRAVAAGWEPSRPGPTFVLPAGPLA